MLTLGVEKREKRGNLKKMRESGFMPAVYYGHKEKATPVKVLQREFLKVLKEAGETSVITLKGADHELPALITEVDLDPVTGVARHADFYVIEKGKKLSIKVPVKYTGTSPAVKDLGGTLVKVLYELEIEALPNDLPKDITLDIAKLTTLESQILAKDVSLPARVTLITDEEEVVASIAAAREEEKEEVAPVDLSAIEVEKKGKEKTEEEKIAKGEVDPTAPAEKA